MTEVEAAVEALTEELRTDIENTTIRLLLADALEDAGKSHLASAHRLIADARPKLNLDKEDREGIVLGYLQWMDLDYIREEHVRIRIGRCQPPDNSWTVECWDKFGGYGFGSASTPNLAKRKAVRNYLYRSYLRYLTGEMI